MQAAAQGLNRAQFGEFELDLLSGELLRSGTLVHLAPQPLKVLALLLSRPGDVVSREDLRLHVWGDDTFVDFEHGLNFVIKKIRDVLEDDADTPRFIQTLPRRGYRFICPVRWIEDESSSANTEIPVPAVPITAIANLDHVKGTPFERSIRVSRWSFWLLASGCLVTALVFATTFGGLGDRFAKGLQRHTPPRVRSIAVLPLENLSNDPQQEYFAEGLTDSLITDLGQIDTMRVISRSSVNQYKGGKIPLSEIASNLKVDNVVEGAVHRSGSTVRISVQLLDAHIDRSVWSHSYERDFKELMGLEKEVAIAIAHEISGRLTPEQELRMKAGTATNAEAYDAYLRGSTLLAQRTLDSETMARAYFEQAVRADPNYAPPYAGLAVFYTLSWGLPLDLELAERNALKAIALDPGMSQGHTALASTRLYQYRYPDAEKELKIALALNPRDALAHQLYAVYWLFMGRPTEALSESSKAIQLDPYSVPYNFVHTVVLYYLAQYDDALEQLQTVSALKLYTLAVREWRVRIAWAAGRAPEAAEEEGKIAVILRSPQMAATANRVAEIYARSGLRPALSMEVSRRVQQRARWLQSKRESLPELYTPDEIAILYARLGDRAATLHWLNEAAREDYYDYLRADLTCGLELDFVRGDPEFQRIQRQFSLPVSSGQ